MDARQKRRAFFFALIRHFRVMWPVLSGVLAAMIVPGLVIGRIEDWSIGESLYFTFVTGFTIGYGDFAPTHFSSRLLAVMIGFAGIVMTGIVAAVAVQALRATEVEPPEEK